MLGLLWWSHPLYTPCFDAFLSPRICSRYLHAFRAQSPVVDSQCTILTCVCSRLRHLPEQLGHSSQSRTIWVALRCLWVMHPMDLKSDSSLAPPLLKQYTSRRQQDRIGLPPQPAYPSYLTADSAKLKATRSRTRNLKQLRTAFPVLVRLQTASQQKKVSRCHSFVGAHRNGTGNRLRFFIRRRMRCYSMRRSSR